MPSITNIVVVGGTHGNEKTGVQCVRRYQNQSELLKRESFQARAVFANEEAIEQNVRYIEQDLNRCFSEALLQGEAQNKEQALAQKLNVELGPKGASSNTDFIIDLHTTTTNMGLTLVVQQHDALALNMAAYIMQKMPEAVLFYEARDAAEDNFLCSIAKHSLLIEVGPIAQGLLRWDILQLTEQALFHGLDFLDMHNRGQLPSLPNTLEAFEFIQKLHLPRDEDGQICGMIHPELQDRDYSLLEPGQPLFILDDGETLCFEYSEPVYVAFVNEAAYYDEAYGLSIMQKANVSIT